MPDKRYKVVFLGEIFADRDIDEVKRNLAALYKMDVSGIERLFSGRRVVVKQEVDHAAALKYVAAFEQAGALCRIEEIGAPVVKAEPPPPGEPAAPAEEPLYRVVFKGDIDPAQDLLQVKNNLAALFKTGLEEVEILFDGRSLVIKDRLDRETARRYVQAMERAGAAARIKAIAQEKSEK
jgi:ribosomal protein L7/L12